MKKLSYLLLLSAIFLNGSVSHGEDKPPIVFEDNLITMEAVALLFISTKQKRKLAQSKGKNIRIPDYYIWSVDSSSYIDGGPYYLINDDSLGTSTRIVCALRGDEADKEADNRKRKHVTLTGKIESYSLRSGLFIDPCSITSITQTQNKVSLTVITNPDNARVRIMNIVPKYKDGIELDEGKYLIEISAEGYDTYKKWHIIDSDKTITVSLEKVSSNTNQITSFKAVTAGQQPNFEIINRMNNSQAKVLVFCGNEHSDYDQFFGGAAISLKMIEDPAFLEKTDILVNKQRYSFLYGGEDQFSRGMALFVGSGDTGHILTNKIRKHINKSAGGRISIEVPNAERKNVVLYFSGTQAKAEFSKFVRMCKTYRTKIGKGISVPAVK